MIVCKNCGHQNEEGDQFCGSCGSFLEWTGEKVDEVAPAAQQDPEIHERMAAEDTARAEQEVTARREAERLEKEEAEARATAEAEARRKQEAERKAREAAQKDAKREADEKAKAKAEAARREAAEREALKEAELRAKEEAEARSQEEVEQKARERMEAEERAGVEAEARRKAEAEAVAREQAEAAARKEVEAKAKAESEARTAAESEKKAKEAAEKRAKEEADAKATAEMHAKEAAERRRRAAAMVAKKPSAPVAEAAPNIAAVPVVPPAAAEPEADQPAAMQPAAPRRRPTPQVKEPPSRDLKAGDLICGECGEGNDPSRKFCRRCGNSLVESDVVVVKDPWWKRIFGGKKEPVAAGERPFRQKRQKRGRGRMRRVVRIVLIVAVLVIAIGVIGPWRDTVFERVGGIFTSARQAVAPKYEPVRPTGAEATSSTPDHPPIASIDQLRNTYWAEGAPGKGEGQTLVIVFDRAFDIDRIGLTPGASAKPEEFVAKPRPKDLHLVFSDGSSADITLEDNAEFQDFDVSAKGVTRVEVQITSVYGSLQSEDCALAEVEFFTKK